MAENQAKPDHKDASDHSAGKVADTAPPAVRAEVVKSLEGSPALQAPEKQGNPVTTDASGVQRLNFAPDAGKDNTGKAPEGAALKPGEQAKPGDATKPTDATARPGDAVKEGSDKLGRTPEERKAISDYADVLKKAYEGDPRGAQKAQERAEQTFTRLSEVKNGKEGQNVGDASPESRMKGSVADQMNGVTKAMESMLSKDGGKFLGIDDPDKRHRATQDAVKDLAARIASPNDYVNQGMHNTCALEALAKTRLENDPAKVASETASVINNGFADVVDNKGNTMRVNVHPASMKPDSESREPFSEKRMKDDGTRGLAGQAMDALAGQTHADLTAKRMGMKTSADGIDKANLVYVTANAGELGAKQGQTSTGEGLFGRNQDGSYQFIKDSPNIDTFGREYLSRTMGNKDGSVYRLSADGKDVKPDPNNPQERGYPPDLTVKTFKSAEDLHKIITQREAETGQSTQLRVHADYLKGDESGHGIHAITVKAAADGKFDMDNNWGTKADAKVTGLSSGADLIRATRGDEPISGVPAPQPGDPKYNPDRPQPKNADQNDREIYRPQHFPRSLDTPVHQNTLDPSGKPVDQLKDPDEKAKQEEDKKKDGDKKVKTGQSPEESARIKYASALREWEARNKDGKSDEPKPDLNAFLTSASNMTA